MSDGTIASRPQVSMDTLGIDATPYDASNDGMSAMLNQLRARLEKMFADQRNMEREFAEQMSGVTVGRSKKAYETGISAAEQNYSAAKSTAWGQIAAGGVGLLGGLGGNTGATLGASAGKVAEGSAGVHSAGQKMDADKTQLLADFQRQSAQELQKIFDAIIERAAELSRQLHATSRDMNNLNVWISKV